MLNVDPYKNVLQAASLKGHEKIVKLLVYDGADLNAQGERYGNVLQAISLESQDTVVQLY